MCWQYMLQGGLVLRSVGTPADRPAATNTVPVAAECYTMLVCGFCREPPAAASLLLACSQRLVWQHN